MLRTRLCCVLLFLVLAITNFPFASPSPAIAQTPPPDVGIPILPVGPYAPDTEAECWAEYLRRLEAVDYWRSYGYDEYADHLEQLAWEAFVECWLGVGH